MTRALALALVTACSRIEPARAPEPQPTAPPAVSAPAPPPESPEEACYSQPAPDPSRVTLGSCDGSWLPPGYVRETSAADTDAIVELVRAWITREDSPGIDGARGIVYAKSDDDSGRDGPYPSFVLREASVECGRHALWLLNSVQLDFRDRAMPGSEGVRCTKNICCYQASGEFDSSGTIVFEMIRQERPVLRAVAIVADNGTLSPDVVSKQRAWVKAQLAAHQRGRCPGEPAGVW